jgi:hypothetical protein
MPQVASANGMDEFYVDFINFVVGLTCVSQ